MQLPPPGNRTVAIAESGLMAAVGCVLFLCWFNPLLYVLAVVFTPIPITLLTYRYGARIGLSGLAATVVAVAAIVGPPNAFLYLGFFGVVGFLTGWLLHRAIEPDRLLLAGGALVCAYDVFAYFFLERLMGLEDSVAAARDGALAQIRAAAGWLPETLGPTLRAFEQNAVDLFRFPLALFFAIALATFVANYAIATLVLERLGVRLRFPRGVMLLRLPIGLGVLAIALWLAGPSISSAGLDWLRIAYLNVGFLVWWAFGAEALSVFLCVINLSSLRVPARIMSLLAFLIALPLWPLIGLADCFLDLRALATRHL